MVVVVLILELAKGILEQRGVDLHIYSFHYSRAAEMLIRILGVL